MTSSINLLTILRKAKALCHLRTRRALEAGAISCRCLLGFRKTEVYLDILTLGLQKSLKVGTLFLFLWQKNKIVDPIRL